MPQDLEGTTFDLRSDFDGYLPTYQDTFQELTESYPDWLNIGEIFDGGCGFGASTLALGRALPRSRIWAVSTEDEPLNEVKEELGNRLHFEHRKIVDFLRHTSKKFGLVSLCRVPFSGISTENDYRTLYSRVADGGYVVMLGDSRLDGTLMSHAGFNRLAVPKGSIAASYTNSGIWTK